MITSKTLWLLLGSSLIVDLTASPIQFPDGQSNVRSITPYEDQTSSEPRFHHHHNLANKHRKKKKKRKQIGCLVAVPHRFRNAGNDGPEGRFFFGPLINYYDTDIHIYNGSPNGKPGGGSNNLDPCSIVTGGLGGIKPINTLGSVINGISGVNPISSITGTNPISSITGVNPISTITGGGSNGGSTPSPPAPVTETPEGGDNEDYDYSDGGDDSNDSDNPSANARPLSNPQGTVVSNVFNSISNGFRPLFERPDRYFDYYVVRPINRSINQLIRWF